MTNGLLRAQKLKLKTFSNDKFRSRKKMKIFRSRFSWNRELLRSRKRRQMWDLTELWNNFRENLSNMVSKCKCYSKLSPAINYSLKVLNRHKFASRSVFMKVDFSQFSFKKPQIWWCIVTQITPHSILLAYRQKWQLIKMKIWGISKTLLTK